MGCDPHAEGLHQIRHMSLWFLILGGLLIVLGMVALAAPWLFTLYTVILFGWMLLVGGVLGVIVAILSSGWRGFAVYLLIGLLDVVIGLLIVSKPDKAAALFTMLLAVLFLGGGFGRVMTATILQFPHWGWSVFGGLISILLGGMIWADWPESTLWVIGTFVGIELIFRGWAWVMFGSGLRRIAGAHQANPAGI